MESLKVCPQHRGSSASLGAQFRPKRSNVGGIHKPGTKTSKANAGDGRWWRKNYSIAPPKKNTVQGCKKCFNKMLMWDELPKVAQIANFPPRSSAWVSGGEVLWFAKPDLPVTLLWSQRTGWGGHQQAFLPSLPFPLNKCWMNIHGRGMKWFACLRPLSFLSISAWKAACKSNSQSRLCGWSDVSAKAGGNWR